jgi:uncharacterized protein
VRVILAIGLFIVLISIWGNLLTGTRSTVAGSISSTPLSSSEDIIDPAPEKPAFSAGDNGVQTTPRTSAALVPRGNEKPSFDCAKAKTAAARLICADQELAQLDGELGAIFYERRARTTAANQADFLGNQFTWIKDRNRHCGLDKNNTATIEVLAAFKPCLISSIRERIELLSRTDGPAIAKTKMQLQTALNSHQSDNQREAPETSATNTSSQFSLPSSPYPHPSSSSPVTRPSYYGQSKCRGPGGLDIGDYAWAPNPTLDDIKNGGWEVCPGKVVMPETYCRWAGRVLPQAQDQTCYAMHLKANPAEYKPEWKRFEADNGAVFALDMKSISHKYYCGGCTDVLMCAVDIDQCFPTNARQVRFDCHGHFMEIGNGGVLQIAPPRSVIGQMADAACVGAKTY